MNDLIYTAPVCPECRSPNCCSSKPAKPPSTDVLPDPMLLPECMFGNANIRDYVMKKVYAERLRHRDLNFNLRVPHSKWTCIMTEELGEVAKAQNEDPGNVETEVVQLAAACVAYLEAMELVRRREKAREEKAHAERKHRGQGGDGARVGVRRRRKPAHR